MPNTNKVKFGIKNCHYAVATIDSNGSATYDTPVSILENCERYSYFDGYDETKLDFDLLSKN